MKENYFDLAALSPEEFEDLVEALFLAQKAEKQGNYTVLKVSRSGRGNDDGRDLLVKTMVEDCATSWEVVWLVQCKHKAKSGNAVQPSDFSNEFSFVDIVTEHGANGYLLVCSTRPGARLQNHLDGLSRSERNPYHFAVWDANRLLEEMDKRQELARRFFSRLREKAKIAQLRELAKRLAPDDRKAMENILGAEE